MGALAVPLPNVVETAARRLGPRAYEAVVDEAVRLLKSPASLWPVDTGRSKRAFRRTGTGFQSRVYNPVRYASYVEEQNRRPAARTLAANTTRLVVAAGRPSLVSPTATERAAEHRQNLVRSLAARERLEADQRLYERYVTLYLSRGPVSPVRITATVRALDRRIRERAS